MKHINVRGLLEEMARFYGLLVPVGEDYWQFTHRTIHDYLSARYWVESGKFRPEEVREWDMEAAYAACLTSDATDAMARMLAVDSDVPAFVECLYNNAPFDSDVIARAIVERVRDRDKYRRAKRNSQVTSNVLEVDMEDFLSVTSSEFLRILLKTCMTVKEWEYFKYDATAIAAKTVAVCSVAELLRRKAKIRLKQAEQFISFLSDPLLTEFKCTIGDSTLTFSTAMLISAAKGSED
jgi:hypothetical protein